MGMMENLFGMLFGGRNVIVETTEVFRENAEAAGQRRADLSATALAQFAAEFAAPRPGRFDCFIDGLNRLPRPAMALGTVALFVAAMWDPLWFAERMVGLSVVPEPLWWLLGAVVSFYFGARHQAKGQAFQRDIAATLGRAPEAVQAIRAIKTLHGDPANEHSEVPDIQPAPAQPAPPPSVRGAAVAAGSGAAASDNAALDSWRADHG